MMKPVFALLVLSLLSGISLPAQVPQVSANDSLVDRTTRLLAVMDSTHRADSLRRLELLREIERLKASSLTAERDALLARLREEAIEDSLTQANQQALLKRLKTSAHGVPVVPFRDTIFFVYTRLGSFTAEQRAAAIVQRIKRLYDDYAFHPDSLKVNSGEKNADIVYGTEIIVNINELEALWHEKTVEQLANGYRSAIAGALLQERNENSMLKISLRIAALLLIITSITLIIKFINRLFRKVRLKVLRMKDRIVKGVRIGTYQFLDTRRILQVTLLLANIVRLAIIVIFIYIALPLMFSIFPWTEGIATTLIDWVLTPLKNVLAGFFGYLPDIFTILVIVVVTHYVLKFMKFIAAEIENGALVIDGFYPEWARPTLNIVKFLVIAFSFIIIFPYLPGSDSPIFRGVSVFLGVLLSLGSSSAISNAIAGLVITYMRPFRIGDRVKIGEISGDIVEKTLLVTRIRTIKNEDVTVPNSSILSGHTINYTTSARELGLIVHTTITIGYDVRWEKVHALMTEAADRTPWLLHDSKHRPFILQTRLDDFYVAYELNAYTEQPKKMAEIYSALHQHLLDVFHDAGIELMSPHFRGVRNVAGRVMPQEKDEGEDNKG